MSDKFEQQGFQEHDESGFFKINASDDISVWFSKPVGQERRQRKVVERDMGDKWSEYHKRGDAIRKI